MIFCLRLEKIPKLSLNILLQLNDANDRIEINSSHDQIQIIEFHDQNLCTRSSSKIVNIYINFQIFQN